MAAVTVLIGCQPALIRSGQAEIIGLILAQNRGRQTLARRRYFAATAVPLSCRRAIDMCQVLRALFCALP